MTDAGFIVCRTVYSKGLLNIQEHQSFGIFLEQLQETASTV